MTKLEPYAWNPEIHGCYGIKQPDGKRTHVKGCKGRRPLRWSRTLREAFSVECATGLVGEIGTSLQRCVPIP